MLLRLLQLADSAFPTGAFAHSGGLEAALRLGDPIDLEAFAVEALWQAAGGALPFVRRAHADPEAAPALDRRLEATLVNHVARRASRLQGRAFALAAGAAFPALAPIAPHHLPVVFGATVRRLGLEGAEPLFLHVTLRGLLSAAVRLGVVGPLEAQRLQASLLGTVEAVLAGPIEEPAQTAPLLDLAQQLHDQLYSRLFQS